MFTRNPRPVLDSREQWDPRSLPLPPQAAQQPHPNPEVSEHRDPRNLPLPPQAPQYLPPNHPNQSHIWHHAEPDQVRPQRQHSERAGLADTYYADTYPPVRNLTHFRESSVEVQLDPKQPLTYNTLSNPGPHALDHLRGSLSSRIFSLAVADPDIINLDHIWQRDYQRLCRNMRAENLLDRNGKIISGAVMLEKAESEAASESRTEIRARPSSYEQTQEQLLELNTSEKQQQHLGGSPRRIVDERRSREPTSASSLAPTELERQVAAAERPPSDSDNARSESAQPGRDSGHNGGDSPAQAGPVVDLGHSGHAEIGADAEEWPAPVDANAVTTPAPSEPSADAADPQPSATDGGALPQSPPTSPRDVGQQVLPPSVAALGTGASAAASNRAVEQQVRLPSFAELYAGVQYYERQREREARQRKKQGQSDRQRT